MDGRAPPGIICLSNVIPYLARREGSGLVRKWESLGLPRRGGGMREGCVYCAILSPGPFPNNGCLHWCSNSRIRLLSFERACCQVELRIFTHLTIRFDYDYPIHDSIRCDSAMHHDASRLIPKCPWFSTFPQKINSSSQKLKKY